MIYLKKILSVIFTAAACTAPDLANGQVFFDRETLGNQIFFINKYSVNTRAFFLCNAGYSLSGNGYSICQADGTWNLPTPTCGKVTK